MLDNIDFDLIRKQGINWDELEVDNPNYDIRDMLKSLVVALAEENEKRQKSEMRLRAIAWLTLIATWGTLFLALFVFFTERYSPLNHQDSLPNSCYCQDNYDTQED